MADDVDPVPPRGAAIGGRLIELLGCLIVVLAVGLVVLQFTQGTLSISGIVLAVFVAVAGGATIVIGRAVERSRGR